MNHDPYVPPLVALDVPEPDTGEKPKKPWAVVLAQLLSGMFALFVVYSVCTSLYLMLTGGAGLPLGWFLVDFVWRSGIVVFLVLTVVGAQLQARYGRVMGLLLIGFFFACCAYVKIAKLASGRLDPHHAVGAEKIGEMMGEAMVFILLAYWFYAFGFSAKARRYFGRK